MCNRLQRLFAIAFGIAAGIACCVISVAARAALWQPLCPDGAMCATAAKAFVANGRVLLSTGDDAPAEWVSIATGTSIATDMRAVSVFANGKYLSVSGPEFTAYDASGRMLYAENHGNIESWAILHNDWIPLGPPLLFAGTTPPTVLSGLTLAIDFPTLYLSQDDGLSVTLQTANVKMSGRRTNFVVAPDARRVWVVPGPATPGLWQTPDASASGRLDFTQLTRIDDGTFPADVFALKTVAVGGHAVALASDGMYVSANLGRSWQRAPVTGVVDDIVFPDPRSADVQVIAARNSVFVSRDRGQTWSALARGLPVDRYALSVTDGALVADGATGVFACAALDCDGDAFGTPAAAGQRSLVVTEFYNTALDHYFMTADEAEKASIRNGGAGPGWIETGQQFGAWAPSVTAPSALVCRFYGDYVKGPNSHFYSASTDECRSLLALQATLPDDRPRWNSEGYAFKVALPDASRRCASGFAPLYRAYNDGFAQRIDSNHRYALDRALLAPLLARGWKDEGIAFCVPPAG